ncbi:MAG: hypothetical protein JF589_03265 [Gemmatimonadetes bacterium]|nr:hypothetical protein [Gemmatimonadota bacterium]
MEGDYSMLIGLISVVCGAGMIGLSYLGAYLLGHSRGRREAEMDRQLAEQDSQFVGQQRADAIQHSLSSMAQAIERLTDAQRVALLDRMRAPEPRPSRAPRQDTPA